MTSPRSLLRDPFSRLKSLYLPNTALRADLLVSLPKMKTHHWVGATLSMKNFFGLVPGGVYGWPKNVLHWAGIDECIADLHAAFPRHFAIVDGIVGMEGNGPIQGKPKPAGVLVAGKRPGGRGRHLLPHHENRSRRHPLSAAGRRAASAWMKPTSCRSASPSSACKLLSS